MAVWKQIASAINGKINPRSSMESFRKLKIEYMAPGMHDDLIIITAHGQFERPVKSLRVESRHSSQDTDLNAKQRMLTRGVQWVHPLTPSSHGLFRKQKSKTMLIGNVRSHGKRYNACTDTECRSPQIPVL